MHQPIFTVVVLSLIARCSLAEPPAFGSSSDDFDINSISSYLDDDQGTGLTNNKGASYSYSNTYHGPNALPERLKGGSGHFTFGQKTAVNSVAATPSAYHTPSNYNQAFSHATQSGVAEYGGGASGTGGTYGGSFDGYGSGSPVGLGSYSNPSFSNYNSPLVAHGTNAVPFSTTPLKSASSPHGSYSAPVAFNDPGSTAFPTSLVGGSSPHHVGMYDGHESGSFGSHSMHSSVSHRAPYPFEKPNPIGPPQYINNYKGGASSSLGPFGPFEGAYNNKPPRHPSLQSYKGFNSGPPSYVSGPSGPSAPLNYKSPYYSDYKTSPGSYYGGRPSHSPFSGYKSPNSFESYPTAPFKYVNESPRYPRYPGKYGSARPGYSGAKLGYSGRPPVYATAFKYGKPSNPPIPSYSGHF